MELNITTLEGKAAGSVQLSDGIFGLEPRKDLIQRCVNWQLAKRQRAHLLGQIMRMTTNDRPERAAAAAKLGGAG